MEEILDKKFRNTVAGTRTVSCKTLRYLKNEMMCNNYKGMWGRLIKKLKMGFEINLQS
jgi:hypothetical protein